MAAIYDGQHSITFEPLSGSDLKNTWDDWFLIPTSRPTMSIPGAQNRFVEIPGMNGSYDLSDYLTSEVTYSDRSGSFEFIVDNDHADWMTVYQSVVGYLNGQRMKMILTDDDEWYYEGRFSVDQFSSGSDYSKIVISYRVAPFKISVYSEFVEDMLWDPFCFERDQDLSLLYHIQVNYVQKEFWLENFGVGAKLNIRFVSGNRVTAQFGGVTKTLDTVNQVETLGNFTRFGKTKLVLNGKGVVDIGWTKLSL